MVVPNTVSLGQEDVELIAVGVVGDSAGGIMADDEIDKSWVQRYGMTILVIVSPALFQMNTAIASNAVAMHVNWTTVGCWVFHWPSP